MVQTNPITLDHQDKTEQREFFEAEAVRANSEYRNQIRVVNAATYRYDRKKQLLKPDNKTPPEDIDAKIRSVSLETLEVQIVCLFQSNILFSKKWTVKEVVWLKCKPKKNELRKISVNIWKIFMKKKNDQPEASTKMNLDAM